MKRLLLLPLFISSVFGMYQENGVFFTKDYRDTSLSHVKTGDVKKTDVMYKGNYQQGIPEQRVFFKKTKGIQLKIIVTQSFICVKTMDDKTLKCKKR